MTTAGHIALINHQLRQLRSALALAYALGRKLILPSVVCGYDKYWGPLWGPGQRGVIPGTHSFALPIRDCPLDHYIEVGMLDPVNTVREYSLLRNPRTPPSVTRDVRHVELELGAKAGVEMARLSALKAVRVLNVTSDLTAADLTGGSTLLSPDQKKAYGAKFKHVSGSWCCAPMDEQKKGAPRSAHFQLMRA